MKAKIGVLFLVLMVGMAAVGASYALWSKTITLTGTVATGDVNIKWSPFIDDDDGNDPGYLKDVADCQVTTTNDLVTVTITNGYPSYTCTINGDITSTGSIPVEAYITINNPNPGAIEVIPSTGFIPQKPNGWIGQLHKDESIKGDFKIHVLQAAEQKATYTFDVKAEGLQFNEPKP